ncbi:unnamed protein product [Sympodiomycopsis kandeliae]
MAEEDDLYDDLYEGADASEQNPSSSSAAPMDLNSASDSQDADKSATNDDDKKNTPGGAGSGSFIPTASKNGSNSATSSFIPSSGHAATSNTGSSSFIPSNPQNQTQQQPSPYQQPQQQHQQQNVNSHVPQQQYHQQGTQPAPIPTTTATNNSDDGSKMFVGGLSWQTSEETLVNYFSQFGKVLECNIMKDNQGISRGFGFLKFEDPKTVNNIMVREHWLDGKTIDPKRAIPRDSSIRSSKIFVGGIPSHTTNESFRSTFLQFGNILDHNLMFDKETNKPRGFGFVTFEDEEAGQRALAADGQVLLDGKLVDVKRATSKNVPGTNNSSNNNHNQDNNNYNTNHNRRQNDNMMSQQNMSYGGGNVGMGMGDMSGMMNPMMMGGMGMDVNSMSQMFQQQGWGTGAWNPAMVQQMLMAAQANGQGGVGAGWNPMMMGGMGMMNNMGAQNNWMGGGGGGMDGMNANNSTMRGFSARQPNNNQGTTNINSGQQQRNRQQQSVSGGNGNRQQGSIRGAGLPSKPTGSNNDQRRQSPVQDRGSRSGSTPSGDAYRRERSPSRRGSNSGGAPSKYEDRPLR